MTFALNEADNEKGVSLMRDEEKHASEDDFEEQNDSEGQQDINEKSDDKKTNDVIPSSALDSILKVNEQYTKVMRDFFKSLEKFDAPFKELQNSMQPVLESLDKIGSFAKKLNESLINIDFKGFHERVKKLLEDIKIKTDELSEHDIYLDIDALENIDLANIHVDLNREKIMRVFEDELDSKVNVLLEEPVLVIHKELIRQSYNSYLNKDFIVATMAIYPVIEHFVTTWSTHEDGEIDPMQLPERYTGTRVKKLLKKYEIDNDAFAELEKMFLLNVLEGYIKIFTPHIEEFKSGLQRNSTLHGYHDFNSISKTDYIKLIQLLKATLHLKNYGYQGLLGEDGLKDTNKQ